MKKIISALLITAMLCSMAVVSASAAVLKNETYDNPEITWHSLGNYYVEEGRLIGDDSAKCFQGADTNEADGLEYFTVGHGDGVFNQAVDMKYTLSAEPDESKDGSNRNFGITYVTDVTCVIDNGMGASGANTRLFLEFVYSWNDGKFYLCNTINSTDFASVALVEGVEKQIAADGEDFTMGMSVTENRVRCYYNDELIFDYTDEDGDLGLVNADNLDLGMIPFNWNNGNIISIDTLTIADAGDLYPLNAEGDDQTPPAEGGDDQTPPAEGGDDTVAPPTGDVVFVVIAAMVIALGSAIIVKKVSVR